MRDEHNQEVNESSADQIEKNLIKQVSWIVSWVVPANTVHKRGKCACKGAGAH